MIENGKQVAIEYSVFLDDNTKIDSNVGKDPLSGHPVWWNTPVQLIKA